MQTDPPPPRPDELADLEPGASKPDAAPPLSPSRPSGRLWVLALAAGLAAAVGAGIGVEASAGRFRPVVVHPPNWSKMGPYAKQDYIVAEHFRQAPAVGAKNTALGFGLLGVALGVTMGLAGGLASRSARGGLAAATAGGLVGIAAGAGVAAALVIPVFFRPALHGPEAGLAGPLLTYLGLFAAVGAAGGMALGLGLGGGDAATRGLLGGACGGLIGAVAFILILSIAYPAERLAQPVPEGRVPRLLMVATAALIPPIFSLVGLQRRRGGT